MSGWVRRLWDFANHIKAAWEWWALLAPLGALAAAQLLLGVFHGQEWDVILLYVMAAIAYAVVIVPELEPLVERLRRGPRLSMGNRMIEDFEHGYFRLAILNIGQGVGSPEVSIVEIFDADGYSLDTSGPFELHWSHHIPPSRAQVSPGDPDKTVGLASVTRGVVRFEGMLYKKEIRSISTAGVPRAVLFRVRAVLPGERAFVEAVFRLDPDAASPLYHRASTVEAPARRLRPVPLSGSQGYRPEPPPVQPGDIFVPRTTVQQMQDMQRERQPDRFSVVQDDRGVRYYERAEIDSLSRDERGKLIGTGSMRQWWWGRRTGTGQWDEFRARPGQWLSREDIDALSEDKRRELFYGVPGLLDWYMAGQKF